LSCFAAAIHSSSHDALEDGWISTVSAGAAPPPMANKKAVIADFTMNLDVNDTFGVPLGAILPTHSGYLSAVQAHDVFVGESDGNLDEFLRKREGAHNGNTQVRNAVERLTA
jgi:hypothetical protein